MYSKAQHEGGPDWQNRNLVPKMENVGMKFSRLTPGLDDLEVFWDGG